MKTKVAELLYKYFQSEILKIQSQSKNWKDHCEYITTIGTKNYYRFKDSGNIPLGRLEQINVQIILLEKRLTNEESDLLIDIGSNSIDNAFAALNLKGKTTGIQTTSWVFQEMKSRQRDLMFHPVILMELAALTLIEENENPFVIDGKLHEEKKRLFTEEAPTNAFFLHSTLSEYVPNLRELSDKSAQLWEIHTQQVKKSLETYKKIHTSVLS